MSLCWRVNRWWLDTPVCLRIHICTCSCVCVPVGVSTRPLIGRAGRYTVGLDETG